MIVTQKHLQRRAFLRGVGAAIALPMLDAMMPAFASTAAKAAAKTPTRLAVVYIPNGVTFGQWKPATEGADFEFPRILKPLEAFRQDLFVLSGLDQKNANALGDGGGDHARAGATFLTGVHVKKTAGSDIGAGVSMDQIAAQTVGGDTRIASLELGCEDSRTVGNCDNGYSCAYTNSVSWRTPEMPMPPETNPRVVFERLFGTDDLNVDPETKARRALFRKSILDVAGERTQKLIGDLGASDRRKMDEYLTAVREVEKRIQNAEKYDRAFNPNIEKPAGIPVAFPEYLKLMFDLQALAFQSDTTRVSTLMIGREGSVRTYGDIGVPDPHHPITHHRNIPELLEKVAKINTHHTELFAYALGKLKATQDGDASLLDRCAVVYGSCINDGNRHSHENLPVLLAGRANGGLKPGRHIQYPEGTPLTNLYMSLLDRMNVHPEKIGDSTGKVEHLTDL